MFGQFLSGGRVFDQVNDLLALIILQITLFLGRLQVLSVIDLIDVNFAKFL
jgi:hypothetical protein